MPPESAPPQPSPTPSRNPSPAISARRQRATPFAILLCAIWLIALAIIAVHLIVAYHKQLKLLTTAAAPIATTSTTFATAPAATNAAVPPPSAQLVPTVYRLLADTGRKWAAGQNLYDRVASYRYSPLVAVLLVPFSWLSADLGGTLWLLLNAALFFWGLLYWLRTAGGSDVPPIKEGGTWDRRPADQGGGSWDRRPADQGEGGARGIGFPADQERGGDACDQLSSRSKLRGGRRAAWSAHRRLLVILAATPLLIGNFNNTQANPMMLGFMLAAVAACLDARFTLAALCLTAATLLKVYPLALGLVLIIIYPRQLSWRIALFLLLGLAVPFAFQHTAYVRRTYLQWFATLAADQRHDWLVTESYRDLALLWRVYFRQTINDHIYTTLQLSAAALAALAAFRMRTPRWAALPRQRLLILLSLVIIWLMLLGPSTESATYMLLAPPVAFFLIAIIPPLPAPPPLRSFLFPARAPAAAAAPASRAHRPLARRVIRFAFHYSRAAVRVPRRLRPAATLFLLAYLLHLSAVIVAATPAGRAYLTHGPQPLAALTFLAGLVAWSIHMSPARTPSPTQIPQPHNR